MSKCTPILNKGSKHLEGSKLFLLKACCTPSPFQVLHSILLFFNSFLHLFFFSSSIVGLQRYINFWYQSYY